MSLSAPFIVRPVATLLLTLAIVLLGILGFRLLPVSPLPDMDFPVITVQASLPGASPQVMAATVATPLERSLGSIAGIEQMTSRSGQGSTRVIVQFELGRDINAAAREVQAAINAARELLPSGMRSMPTYRKVNPTQAPIMVLALTSEVLEKGQLYDLASTVVAQKLSQVQGVGDVQIGGSSLPAVRVELQPRRLEHYGIALDEVRQAINATSVRKPKGQLEQGSQHWQIQANDQLHTAESFAPLIIRYHDGAALRLSDVAKVYDSVENRYNSGFFNHEDAVLLVINRQANANIIATIEAIQKELPSLQAVLPASANLQVAMDRSSVIRATLHEAEQTLLLATGLVMLVVWLFLGHWRSALIPAFAVPVSLIGSFAVMYLLDFSLNNLSLMALIIATGLVVDDAIVVLENIARHIKLGLSPLQAAFKGSKEVGFTLLSMNLSLVVVFVSILFMGGIIERLFREFSITLTVAILISLLVSLTLTPMLCAKWLSSDTVTESEQTISQSRWQQRNQQFQAWVLAGYERGLNWSLRHRKTMLLGVIFTIAANIALFISVPKTFMPQQDTGQLMGMIRSDDGLSYHTMQPKMEAYRQALLKDPDVASVAGFIGGGSNAFLIVRLKPITERSLGAQAIVNRLRTQMPQIAGSRLFLWPEQDMNIGGREGGSSQYEYALLASDLADLREWQPKVRDAFKKLPELTDIDSREGRGAQQITLAVDREQAARLGVDMAMVTALLNNAFSQRQVATIYETLNQYSVVMELGPEYVGSPEALHQLKMITADGKQVPLSAFTRWQNTLENERVMHEGQFAVESINFALAEGVSLDQAARAIEQAMAEIALPTEVQGKMGGTAGAFQSTQSNQGWMILLALVIVYLVLGVLYESYVHPLTILSTLPSAGVGALLAIQLTGGEFSLISLLGLFLLIGIVKKNAILMIDFALQLQREQGMPAIEAIHAACLQRFRPIMMTTMAAILGALPLLLSSAEGSEMRQPLGLAIVGGLVLSQMLTLFSTPVVYLFFERFNRQRSRLVVNKDSAPCPRS
ncbi:efflux RND transporter permease subunit [Thiopseudomonas alkaliphila]|uniref:efflux RND transporter permease subunit n=1 Tax=Thiopseudomonas alkaliphila TaxID=1697053 RepID=UPI00069DE7C8|nr:efflux RND transporter permease subunit [Thiopseudomonas alkaliphila]AKX51961.1 acriflavine resistance protein B [Thiopseudomonas alkaliphila]AKX58262.1 acriflavine resistance protein B [Thiopseudomonas alkaliphila]